MSFRPRERQRLSGGIPCLYALKLLLFPNETAQLLSLYIMASESGTLYIGMTNDLERRVFEHKNELMEGFTKDYSCKRLVYYEHTEDVEACIAREKQIKNWRRDKKEKLIRSMNPSWKDLGENL
jgi:putative endonuclease